MGGGAGEAPGIARSMSIDTLPETPRSAQSASTRKDDDCESPASMPVRTPPAVTVSALADLQNSGPAALLQRRLGGIRENVVAPLLDGADEEDDEEEPDLVDDDEDDDEEEETPSEDNDDDEDDEDENAVRQLESAHAMPASPDAGYTTVGIPGCFGAAPPLSPGDSDQKRPCVLSVEDEIGIEALLDFSSALPSRLPDVPAVERDRLAYAGPTDESNWVIPGRLMVGAYPAEADHQAHEALLTSVLNCGVTTFVCLQAEYNHYAPATAPIRPYIRDAFRLCKAREKAGAADNHKVCASSQLAFLHLPIVDCNVTSDEVVRAFAEALCWRLVTGEVVYLHCWGGHGRTGTLVAVMLGMLYKISKAEALKRTQLYHDCRSCPLQVQSPQTFSQRMQVLRILDSVRTRPSILEQHLASPHASRDLGKVFELPVDDAPPASSGAAPDDVVMGDAAPQTSFPRKKHPLESCGASKEQLSRPMDLCKRRRLALKPSLRSLKPPPMCTGQLGIGPAQFAAMSTPPRHGSTPSSAGGTPSSASQQYRKRNLHLVR